MLGLVFALAFVSSAQRAAAADRTPPRESGGLFIRQIVPETPKLAAPALEIGLPAQTALPQTATPAPLIAPLSALAAPQAAAGDLAAAPAAPDTARLEPLSARSELQTLDPASDSPRVADPAGPVFDGRFERSAEETLAPGSDVSEEYREARATLSRKQKTPHAFTRGEPELARLKDYKILFVPGFMSGAFIRLSQALGKDAKPWQYFGHQMRWLAQAGVAHEVVPIHSEQTVEHNAAVIRERVAASEKPVIIISHSKGGLDTLEALLGLREAGLLDKVAGWIPVQSPFLGAPGADRVAANPVMRLWVAAFLEHPYVGGSWHAMKRMTTKAAEESYRLRRGEISHVLRAVPTVAFTSWKEAGIFSVLTELTKLGLSLNPFLNPRLFFSPLLGLALILKGASETLSWLSTKSDGLVPAEKGRLPEMDFVEEGGVDHFVPFVDHGGTFDRLEFTQALLKLVLKRVKPRAR